MDGPKRDGDVATIRRRHARPLELDSEGEEEEETSGKEEEEESLPSDKEDEGPETSEKLSSPKVGRDPAGQAAHAGASGRAGVTQCGVGFQEEGDEEEDDNGRDEEDDDEADDDEDDGDRVSSASSERESSSDEGEWHGAELSTEPTFT